MISIIIPLYNVERYVVECLESVVAQTHKDLEIVLVDDCCTDDTVKAVEDFLTTQKDVRYKLVHHEKNSGLSAARNTGMDNTSGEYIYFLDSDDILEPTAIENLYKAITSGDYAIAISYFCKYIDGKKETYRDDWTFTKPRVIEPQDFAYRMLTEKSNFASTAKLYRRDVVKDLRFRLGKRNEDTLFIVDMIPVIERSGYRCIDIPDYSYLYRMREGSICHNQKLPLEVDVIKNYDEAIKTCVGKSETIEWLKQRQISMALGLAFKFLGSKEYSLSLYLENCKFLSKFSNSYVKRTRTAVEYKNFLELKYFPLLYRFYYRRKL